MKNLLFIAAFCIPFTMQINAQSKNKNNDSKDTASSTSSADYKGPKGCETPMNSDQIAKVYSAIKDETDMDEILKVAKKAGIAHCYTTDQLKPLLKLLKSDANRLEFFKAVYPHIYDLNNYMNVAEAFKESSYKEKLRTVVKNSKE